MRALPLMIAVALVGCNTAPDGLEISLSPEVPITTDPLVVTIDADAIDDNGDEIVYRYRWSRDGTSMPAITDGTVPFGQTTKGETWEVAVAPFDGKQEGTPASATVTIANAPPTALATLSPDQPRTDDDLVVDVQTDDADNDPVSVSYRWILNGSPSTEDGERLRSERTNKGEVWEVLVTPNDREVDGEPITVSVTIGNTPPSVDTARIVAVDDGPLNRAATLSCVGEGWEDVDGDPEGYTASWTVNGVEVPDVTTTTLDSVFARGDQVVCVLTPFDGDDAGDSVTSAPVSIVNSPPSLDTVTIAPEEPTREDTVVPTLGTATDPDGDPVTFLYSWRVDGRVAGTTETLASSRFVRGSNISVVVTPTDGTDPGEPVTSNVVRGGNNPPEITSAVLDPTTVYTDTVIEAVIRASDFDGDSTTASVEWFVNGTKLSVTGPSLDGATFFDKGDSITAVVRADDGTDRSEPISTSALSVLNSPPTAPEISLDPSEPTPGDDIECVIDTAATDKDGDTLSYSFTWEVNDSTVSGTTTTYTNDTLASSSWSEGDRITCIVSANDGTVSGPETTARFGLVTADLDFPSTDSTTRSGTLGTGGGGAFFRTGDYVSETFTATGVPDVEELDYELEMDDRTTSVCTVGTLRFAIKINGTEVGRYSYTGGSTRGRISFSGTETFTSISGTGSDGEDYTLRIEALDTVCPGASSWNWYSGGTFTFNP